MLVWAKAWRCCGKRCAAVRRPSCIGLLCSRPSTRHFSSPSHIKKLRNIGIVAHIDAGKTTITEQILVQTGVIRSAGLIKHGNTTTDYLECEQNRGITVNAAFVQASWKGHTLNIIDTPGHIDFNVEVERSLRVLDGALVVIDGTRGAEPQTVTVWQQLKKFNVPSIIFLSKFDRERRDLHVCLESIRAMLKIEPVLLNYPVLDEKMELVGVSDTISESSSTIRTDVVECLANLDAALEEVYMAHDMEADKITNEEIMTSLKQLHAESKIVPVCVGSGITGIGVGICLDHIVNLLPSPLPAISKLPSKLQDQLCGVVFKSSVDDNRRVWCQSRIYSGSLQPGSRVYNTRTKTVGRVSDIYQMDAEGFIFKETSSAGDIIVIGGCKEFRTGDVFVDYSWESRRNELEKSISFNKLLGSTISFSEPLFFCTVECPEFSQQEKLEQALEKMAFEDPVLTIRKGKSDEILLGGCGQLHLNVTHERLRQEHGVQCNMFKLRVAYRETVVSPIRHVVVCLDNDIVMEIRPCSAGKHVEVECSDAGIKSAVEDSVASSLEIGPLTGLPMINVSVSVRIHRNSRLSFSGREISRLFKTAIKEAFQSNEDCLSLCEPFADVEVYGPVCHCDSIISDFVRRIGSSHYDVTYESDQFVLIGKAPLSKLSDYSSRVRGLSSGGVVLKRIKIDTYYPLSRDDNLNTIKKFNSGQFWA